MVLGDEERAPHESIDVIEHVDRAHRLRLTNCSGCLEREATSEDRRASEHALLGVAEKIETPVDCGSERLVPVEGGACPRVRSVNRSSR